MLEKLLEVFEVVANRGPAAWLCFEERFSEEDKEAEFQQWWRDDETRAAVGPGVALKNARRSFPTGDFVAPSREYKMSTFVRALLFSPPPTIFFPFYY